METELKPCPFCGGMASVGGYVYEIGASEYTTHDAECNDCHATTFEYPTEEEAIEAWNRRTKDGN